MPLNKKQLKRMLLFISEVKQNRYPNSYSFAEFLRKTDIDDNMNIACSSRTIQRDIEVLKKDFDAPLRYDHDNQGYILDVPGWEFSIPVVSESEMLAMVMGGRFAESILPDSDIKFRILEAVAQQLSTNSAGLLEHASIDSLMICGRMSVHVDGRIFQTVFDAWRNNEALDIEYINARGIESRRRVDPHILAFQDGGWFIKGFCHLKDDIRLFALHRIKSAVSSKKYFTRSRQLTAKTRKEGLFELPTMEGVVLRCEERIFSYALDYFFHKDQSIRHFDNGFFELHIPSVPEDEIIRWIMSQAGRAVVVQPESLKSKIKEYAAKILENS